MCMQLKKQEVQLDSRVEYFYAISSIPRKGVQHKDLKLRHNKMFIQSTSQGSRCLKKGEKILYLKEVRIIGLNWMYIHLQQIIFHDYGGYLS
jgi:hypothetical protein